MQFLSGIEKSELRSNVGAFLVLFFLAVLIRLPFFFKYSINWDENTFILMGQSLLEGNLPYVELWDNKPPLAFAPFAFFSWLFGKNIVGIRIGATIFVTVTAYITLQIGKHLWGKQVGFLAGLFCVFFYSWGFGKQTFVPEIIASVPLMAAVAIGVMRKESPESAFIVGFLISLATLVTMNLAYLSVWVGLYIVAQSVLDKDSSARRIPMYILGGIVPIGLVSLPYVIGGHSQILFDSVIKAPLQYVNSNLTAFDSFVHLISNEFENKNAVLWLGFLGGIGIGVVHWKSYSRPLKQGLKLMAIFFLAINFSIINSGGAFSHYLVHLVGIMALLAGYFYNFLSLNISRIVIGIILIYCLICSTSAWQRDKHSLYLHYVNMVERLKNHQPLSRGTGYELAAYLREENPSKGPVYLMDFHIAYWLTGTKPLSKIVTHPSNISKEYLLKVVKGPQASAESEMAELLKMKPRFIVKHKKPKYLSNIPKARKLLEKAFQTEYSLVKVIRKAYIYKRNDATDKLGIH